ncbi:hypothetical protein TCAL_07788 [Tigriopus californicus]|uniref:Nuclear receptor domain-containing protein n=1 Tax=Tigriopus californicus TaxID=6832 RepID=A0A553PSG0_TIGCA|nr:hypothetical protein TCAL_07788 [Tigriopus californicus]|eukprot:TCALIF_07788-PA protein Name:"Similar to vdra Vitamin D3 receptor A (Danio rerio)" AED:0.34 eAED:0.35 QI:0/-1/0/1/-1/1/1/0/738
MTEAQDKFFLDFNDIAAVLSPKERMYSSGNDRNPDYSLPNPDYQSKDEQPKVVKNGNDRQEPKRSLICSVCGAQTGNFHLNYGASTCLSCRAFFRRTVQCGDNVKFVCKGDGQKECQITEKNRKKCKLCRYRACVSAGMRGDQVMSSEEKKTWFRKMNKKKVKNEKSEEGDDQLNLRSPDPVRKNKGKRQSKRGSVSDGSSDSNLDLCPASLIPYYDSMISQVVTSTVENSPDMTGYPTVMSGESSSSSGSVDTLDLLNESVKVEIAFAVSQIRFDPMFVDMVCSQGEQTCVTKLMLKNHMELVRNTWVSFCQGNMDFCSLSQTDQASLLAQNGPMFQAAVLARFFCSSYRQDQLNWLFLGQQVWSYEPGSDLVNFSFSHWNSANGLVRNVTQLLETLNLMGAICSFSLPIDFLGILAYACLFHTNSSSNHLYQSPDVIYNYSLKASAMAGNANVNTHLLQCHLEGLRDLSTMMTTWDWSYSVGIHHVNYSYGDLEETILQQEFKTMDRIFKEVPLGQDVVEELIAYAMDVPVSKGFMRRALVTWKRRFAIIMKQHSEFTSLSDREQAILVEKTCLPTFGVAKLWSENLPSVRAQIEFALGVTDISFLMERVSPVLPSFTPKKLTVQGLNKSAKLADLTVVARFEQLKLDLNYLVTDIEFYKIMLLMTMFLPAAQLFPDAPVAKLSTKYLHILLRRSQFLDLADETTINRSIKLIAEIGEIIKVIFGIQSKGQLGPTT